VSSHDRRHEAESLLGVAPGSRQEQASEAITRRWDEEYRSGRYVGAEPVGFVDDILSHAAAADLSPGRGLYIGCGNGRNYLPLVEGGLDLIGLDVSATALEQLSERAAGRPVELRQGELSALSAEIAFSIVIGIQVFQHGREAEAHAHIGEALLRVRPGGLFCIRVNAAGTEIHHRHRVVERREGGGLTVEYLAGPKSGLFIHFFDEAELAGLLEPFEPVLTLRCAATQRRPPENGRWLQWEGIWRKPTE
jgi:SAM-dependent methyltransferase